ncbi:MAG: hypothetical protein CVU23_02155 [Betaproteobacteria bacterium HGW-Betaproteobacteria-17]|nr:MAG: hypothetical protein CVU23_02155 [Betaproteobacteria bacterium HGW-Betaproteobacteria-17]
MSGFGLDKKREETLKFRFQPGVDTAQLIAAEAVNLVYSQSRISVISHFVLVPIMAYVFSGSVPPTWLWLWVGLLAGAVLIRILLVRHYLRSDIYTEDSRAGSGASSSACLRSARCGACPACCSQPGSAPRTWSPWPWCCSASPAAA